ncbi:MAG: hypothetical protein WC718_14445 [Phycisphaerales bacterium]|jgi:hypothetical protein
MPKIVVNVSVKGTDLKQMMASAKEQMADLGAVPWKITQINLWGQDDAATRQGMVKLWSASMDLEANISE